jgi:hypothetical protein
VKTKHTIAAATLALSLAPAAEAALNDRGGGLIYDDVLDITWLQDANLFKTLCDASDPIATGFVSGGRSATDICGTDGRMTWGEAEAWMARLRDQNYLGYSDWRQWIVPGAAPCSGYDCTDSEMGHLFNVTLGNPDAGDGSNCYNPPTTDPDHCLVNTGPFANFQSGAYWSGTEYAPNPVYTWAFVTLDGSQNPGFKPLQLYVWAVRPGDVAAAPALQPVPTLGAWGLGLLGLLLAGLARRRLW